MSNEKSFKNTDSLKNSKLEAKDIIVDTSKFALEAEENAQYNKKSCAALIERVQAAEVAVQALNRRRQENEKNFRNQSYYYSFERFVAILREIKGFIQDVTHLSGYRKFISSVHIKERFQQLITDFDNVVGDLQLAMVIANEEERRSDIAMLQEDIDEMTKFLEKIEGGVTTIDKKISNVLEHILTLKGKSSEKDFNPIINRIDPNELKEPVGGSQPVVSSRNKHKIHKKLYRGQNVACKLIAEEKNKPDEPGKSSESVTQISSRVHSELAILSNLGRCDHVINFHGLCEKDGSVLGVFGWAENGNLRELYEKFDIEWPRKLDIALNICRGITFLHGCQILHHDIRCENILITDNLKPKISNFKYSRALQANTTNIGNITQIVRWLAPEKMNSKKTQTVIAAAVSAAQQAPKKDEGKKDRKDDDYVPYTIQCEIFSFGMLLWELAFQRFPYKDMEIAEIQKHVLNGKREHLNFPLSSFGVEKGYGNIIEAAWQSDPSLRPELSYLFNDLENLSSPFISDRSPRGLNPKRSDMEVTPMKFPPGDIDDFDLDQMDFILPMMPMMPMMSLEDGISAHRIGDREKAFECFEKHAEMGNNVAKYWLGYYYWEGRVVDKNLDKAVELFKEAADEGNPDAQLRYAFALVHKKSPIKYNLEEFMKYLTMSAENGNTVAQFNLGDLYFNGKLGIPKDEEKGLSYLKLAAIKGLPKACAMLDKLKINYLV
ncbi:kinase-like domain-containing protein [Rhizophagus diaphanus]|nr:kinase-like domain-containing protein [Rhizophagus diaphanus] [Rhizophagus sp. MUCL 43196]